MNTDARTNQPDSQCTSERGFALVAFLVVVGIGLYILANSLSLATTSTRTNRDAKQRSDQFFASDNSLSLAVGWFRTQATNLITPFQKGNFYTTFSKGSPTVGTNDSVLSIPTKIKLAGTNNSVILTSSNSLGTAAFPATQNLSTSVSFAAASSFSGSSFGANLVRATLVDAVAVDPSSDFGAPPAPAPQTDFYPIYRLDALTAADRGSHLLGYMIGTLTYSDTVGFYGRDLVELRQSCDSYISSNGPYGAGSKRAKCPVGSNSTVQIHQNTKLYGSARTNGNFSTGSPWGGQVCADFACSSNGQTCAGGSCNVPALPTFQSWNSYCPTNQGDRTVSTNQTWTVGGSSPNQKCWNNVTLGNNRTLTLTSTGPNNAYFINTLNIPNNASLQIAPNPASGTVYLYVVNFSGSTVNGNQVFNGNNRPSQFRLYYLGLAALTFNGNAAINASVVSPYAGVTVSGNHTFSGGILATSLTFTGSGSLHYDESLGGQTLTGMTYRLRDKIQYYN